MLWVKEWDVPQSTILGVLNSVKVAKSSKRNNYEVQESLEEYKVCHHSK
jgi:hypothetical protein